MFGVTLFSTKNTSQPATLPSGKQAQIAIENPVKNPGFHSINMARWIVQLQVGAREFHGSP